MFLLVPSFNPDGQIMETELGWEFIQIYGLTETSSTIAVLTPDERELGCAIVELGGGSTNVSIFHGGKIRHTASLLCAGGHVTNDIVHGLQVTQQDAERHIEAAKSGRTVRIEWHRRNKDGSLHWDEVTLKPAVLAGRKRILAFTREITDRKADHEALRAGLVDDVAYEDQIEDKVKLAKTKSFARLDGETYGKVSSESLGLSMANLLLFSEPPPLAATVMSTLSPGTISTCTTAGVLSLVFLRSNCGSATIDARSVFSGSL